MSLQGLFKVMRQYFVLQQQNMFLTFPCDINLWLIEGPHLLLASVTSAFILTALHGEGQGVKHTSCPAPLAVVTSTGLLTQTVSQRGRMNLLAGCKVFEKTQNKRFQVQGKIQTSLISSHFCMKYHTAIRKQTLYYLSALKLRLHLTIIFTTLQNPKTLHLKS